jgi:chromosome segregation ATPase
MSVMAEYLKRIFERAKEDAAHAGHPNPAAAGWEAVAKAYQDQVSAKERAEADLHRCHEEQERLREELRRSQAALQRLSDQAETARRRIRDTLLTSVVRPTLPEGVEAKIRAVLAEIPE